MVKEIKEKIKEEIDNLKTKDDEYLTHIFKIITSKKSKKEKDLYSSLLKAVEKERKLRGVKEVDAKGIGLKPTKGRGKK